MELLCGGIKIRFMPVAGCCEVNNLVVTRSVMNVTEEVTFSARFFSAAPPHKGVWSGDVTCRVFWPLVVMASLPADPEGRHLSTSNQARRLRFPVWGSPQSGRDGGAVIVRNNNT
eukprot:1109082-Rhodomonas_salina.1